MASTIPPQFFPLNLASVRGVWVVRRVGAHSTHSTHDRDEDKKIRTAAVDLPAALMSCLQGVLTLLSFDEAKMGDA
jgi:hypothetical protein